MPWFPALGLRFGENQQAIKGSPLFKRTCHLQVLQLEEDSIARHPANRLGIGTRGEIDRVPNPLARRLYVLKCNHAEKSIPTFQFFDPSILLRITSL